MKILIDLRCLLNNSFGGIQKYAEEFIKNILDIDKKNEYILFENSLTGSKKHFKNTKIVNFNIPNKIFDSLAKLGLIGSIDKLVKADLIYSPHFNYLKVSNAKRIITIHDLSFIHYPSFFNLKQNLWHKFQNIKSQADVSEIVITNSEFTKQDIVNILKIPKEKIKVIYPGISDDLKPISENDPSLISFKQKYKINYPFLLYLGTIEPRKNINSIIKSFNLLKKDNKFSELKLILAGNKGWLYKNIENEAKKSEYRKDIIFWGRVLEEEKIFLYNLCECFIYPSFFEGFGFPPLEAEKCGAPTIVSDRASLKETNPNAPKINPWKPEELKEAIGNVLEDKNYREELRRLGIQNAKKFSWRLSAIKLIEIFETYGSKTKNTN